MIAGPNRGRPFPGFSIPFRLYVRPYMSVHPFLHSILLGQTHSCLKLGFGKPSSRPDRNIWKSMKSVFNQFQPFSTMFNRFQLQQFSSVFNCFQPFSTSINRFQPLLTAFNPFQLFSYVFSVFNRFF